MLEPSATGIIMRPLDVVIREVQAFFADAAPPEAMLSEELERKGDIGTERGHN